MNKFTALNKLANAYHYLMAQSKKRWEVTDFNATEIIEDHFNRIRRSLRIGDLKPAPKCVEGINPKGPTWL